MNRRARQVEKDVDVLVEPERLGQVVVHEHEPVVADVLDVGERAGIEVVDADDAVPALEEMVAEVGAEKAGAAGDEGGAH